MPYWLSMLRIDHAEFLFPLYGSVAALALYLVCGPLRRARLLRIAIALAVGAGFGVLIGWLVSDVWDTFDVALKPVTRMWIALACAGVSLAAINLWRTRWWRKAIALIFVPLVLASAAAGINVDYGAYPHLRDALGIVPYSALPEARLSGHAGRMDAHLGTDWIAPHDMPRHGIVGTATIPGTRSKFHARPAIIYLPPAALVENPPVLPVMVLFAGQPGAPSDVFTSGRVAETFDAYAARHNGLAPIVVAADQLAYPGRNPMCVDSPLGNAATYLTVDVPTWLRGHLPVADSGRYWAVGGYSEGGTCAIQFGAGHPDLFASVIDVLGEREPTIGPDTVAKAFNGSAAAYDAAKPLTLLAEHTPYPDSVAIFGTGSQDVTFSGYARTLHSAAARAGMKTRLIVSPDSGHDWNTVRYVFARALPEIADRLGLSR
ncbi:alpha/beta hydrolase-fold protein [Humibacter antri]